MVAIAAGKVSRARLGALLIAALAAGAFATLPAVAGSERPAHVRVSRVTPPPAGWIEFCTREPGECAGTPTTRRRLDVSRDEAWADLVRVNDWVNQTIQPLTDLEHWGVVEHWSYPDDGYGDCEDYVLLKRRMLMQSGWPREALLITVVRDLKGDGHAVLTVTTDKGDYVLDNQNEKVLPWSKTGYRFIKRQSQSNPNEWVLLSGPQPPLATASR
jgi:predicted transglutaminase-like cysteine proteinase